MLAHRLRRWPAINPALFQRLVYAVTPLLRLDPPPHTSSLLSQAFSLRSCRDLLWPPVLSILSAAYTPAKWVGSCFSSAVTGSVYVSSCRLIGRLLGTQYVPAFSPHSTRMMSTDTVTTTTL